MNKIKFKLVAKGNPKDEIWNTKVVQEGPYEEVVAHVAEWLVRTLITDWNWDKKEFKKRMEMIYNEVKLEIKDLEESKYE